MTFLSGLSSATSHRAAGFCWRLKKLIRQRSWLKNSVPKKVPTYAARIRVTFPGHSRRCWRKNAIESFPTATCPRPLKMEGQGGNSKRFPRVIDFTASLPVPDPRKVNREETRLLWIKFSYFCCHLQAGYSFCCGPGSFVGF